VAASQDRRGNALRVGGEAETAGDIGDGSQAAGLRLVVAIGERPVGVREHNNPDHERLDLDELPESPGDGELPVPPPDSGEPGARRHEHGPESDRTGRGIQRQEHGNEAEDDQRDRVGQA
jgi:hypothetical protein